MKHNLCFSKGFENQQKLNLWTAPFESEEQIENNLQDWIQFMELGMVNI